ncbi:MAG: M20/M25/M40 family metallo-hydrolase [Cryobacterium sp.]|nr:M20/M25/M40 family metallo-hydrolase [Oligoflexia bacterium]
MTSPNSKLSQAAAQAELYLNQHFENALEELKQLAKIPSVSFAGFDPAHVRKSAEATAVLLKKVGFENVEVLNFEDAHPYVYADYLKAGPDAPTALLYAHHDVQPAGRDELWLTPAFTPTLKEGPGGARLYGRGTADDKAGILVHAAALEAFLKTSGSCPLNLKVVIEGEEEIGSGHLHSFLKAYAKKLQADVIILTDTANFDCGKPALTIALRGLIGVDVEVRALTKAVHSGMWGGPVPDPVVALAKVLASLVDEDGRIAVPGIREMVTPLTEEEIERMKKIPFEEKLFREQVGMVQGAKLLTEGPNPIAQLWRFPSLTITAIQASERKEAANRINDTAWARVTIRTAPGMDAPKTAALLKAHMEKVVPWGLEISVTGGEHGSGAWAIDPTGPAFEAAKIAMTKGYGEEPLMIGCGGSIPFVQPFAEALGGVPALLIGVEDPYTNAHGENESLLVSDLRKACVSQIHLFAEIAERLRPARALQKEVP